ncbi:MAG TPA: class I SAM-dependent methyltransferase [Acidimicrobiales bacterium]|nr:class I SAM-dependent methyltransferase [Acidimicrobiales bacterium]
MRDGYGVPDAEVQVESERLRALTSARDRRTFRVIDRIGIGAGAVCLEVGAGSGTISRGLAERAGAGGRVWSVDKDLRFHEEMPPNVEVKELDLVTDDLPGGHFDFVHARAVLQHIPERDDVFRRLATATKPGGWLLVEDSDMRAFAEQPLPQPFGTVHRILATDTLTPWRDPNFGTRLLACFTQAGFEDVGMDGAAGLMQPGRPSGEWWLLAVDRVLPRLVESSMVTAEQAEACRSQMRDEGLVMVGPLMLAVWGRRPAA